MKNVLCHIDILFIDSGLLPQAFTIRPYSYNGPTSICGIPRVVRSDNPCAHLERLLCLPICCKGHYAIALGILLGVCLPAGG